MNQKQFGFRSNHSTYVAVIEVVDKTVNAITNHSGYIFRSKALDSINHDRVLNKLEHYGFRGLVIEWFESYRTNQKQFVRYQMHDSYHKTI